MVVEPWAILRVVPPVEGGVQDTRLTRVAPYRLALCASLRENLDYTCGRLGSIESSCRGTPYDLDPLDIFGVDIIETRPRRPSSRRLDPISAGIVDPDTIYIYEWLVGLRYTRRTTKDYP